VFGTCWSASCHPPNLRRRPSTQGAQRHDSCLPNWLLLARDPRYLSTGENDLWAIPPLATNQDLGDGLGGAHRVVREWYTAGGAEQHFDSRTTRVARGDHMPMIDGAPWRRFCTNSTRAAVGVVSRPRIHPSKLPMVSFGAGRSQDIGILSWPWSPKPNVLKNYNCSRTVHLADQLVLSWRYPTQRERGTHAVAALYRDPPR
jgi:hypothetical protein